MSVVPGPASQDAVFKLVFASPALQCRVGGGFRLGGKERKKLGGCHRECQEREKAMYLLYSG